MRFKLGAATIEINFQPRRYYSRRGYVRALGIHFDFSERTILGVNFWYIRLREQDGHHLGPTFLDRIDFHAGYREDDRFANKHLPSYRRYY